MGDYIEYGEYNIRGDHCIFYYIGDLKATIPGLWLKKRIKTFLKELWVFFSLITVGMIAVWILLSNDINLPTL